MQLSSATPKNQDVGIGVARLLHALTPPRSAFFYLYSFWHGVIHTSYFMIFILISFYPGLALTVACGEMIIGVEHAFCLLYRWSGFFGPGANVRIRITRPHGSKVIILAGVQRAVSCRVRL